MKAWACLVCPDCSGTGLRKMPKGKEARTEATEPPGKTYRRVGVGRIGE